MSTHVLTFTLDDVTRFDEVDDIAVALVARWAGWSREEAQAWVKAPATDRVRAVLTPLPGQRVSDRRARIHYRADVEVTV